MIVQANHAQNLISHDHSRVTANLHFKDTLGHEEKLLLPIAKVKEALKENRGMGFLDVQLPGEEEPRHVIINRFVMTKDGRSVAHLVLKEIGDQDPIRALVPVVITGLMPTKLRKLTVDQKKKSIDLRGPAGSLDHPIYIRVSDYSAGDVVRAKDIQLPSGAVLCSDPDDEVFRIR